MSSTLNPENINERDRRLNSGHGTSALGPSDTSDSGSDIQGGEGLDDDLGIGLNQGTNSDPDQRIPVHTAGPDVGDANLDSDSDSSGSGERASAGRDVSFSPDEDIDTDRIDRLPPEDFEHDESDIDPDRVRARESERPQARPR
jgi:hypothetical protein